MGVTALTPAEIAKIYNIPVERVRLVDTNGNVTINFKTDKKTQLTKKDIDRYVEVRNILNKYNKSTKKDDKEKLAKRNQYASYTISANGKAVFFTVKEDISAEEFKKIYDLKNGALKFAIREVHNKGLENGDIRCVNSYVSDSETNTKVREYSDGVVESESDHNGRPGRSYKNVTLQAGYTYQVACEDLKGKSYESVDEFLYDCVRWTD